MLTASDRHTSENENGLCYISVIMQVLLYMYAFEGLSSDHASRGVHSRPHIRTRRP